MNDKIIVRGAREHNLKNVSLEVPKNKLVVFTGVSGSGKSSMAFDTIYAEGQRRYVESLSSYARQFLGLMGKPDVDSIEGLSPSISIDQKSVSHNPRSTVGTITEIYDYLRLMYARIGHPFCPNCGTEIAKLSIDEITDNTVGLIKKTLQADKLKPLTFQIMSPVVRNRKGEYSDLLDNIRTKGYEKVIIDGIVHSLEKDILLIKTNKHTIEVIIDTITLSNKDAKNEVFLSNVRSRLFSSIEQSLNLSDGLVIITESTQKLNQLYSEKFSCPTCGFSLPEIEPRMFSFNSPLGACETCKGLGFISKINPERVINRRLSIDEGGILPYSKVFFKVTWFSRLLREFLNDEGINSKKPIGELTKEQIKLLLFGTKKQYRVEGKNRFGEDTTIYETFLGIVPELEKRYYESESDFTMYEIGRYMENQQCDTCRGMRLRPEVLSIKINNLNIFEMGEMAINDLYDLIDQVEQKASQYEREIAREIIKEVKARLLFLDNVGLKYLTLNRSSATLSGGESQRIRLASQIGSGLTGVLYVLDEPSIGLHSKDVAALIKSLENLRDIGNSLIVVEHDPETIEKADYIVDFGPYAGKKGGHVIFSGTYEELKNDSKSLTSQYLFRTPTPAPQRTIVKKGSDSYITIHKANQFNLKNITAKLPLGKLICVTGVSGSGKSTLVVETLYKSLVYHIEGRNPGSMGAYERLEGHEYLDKVYLVDQSPIGRTPRSNPATYVGLFDHIRDIFADTNDSKIRGYKKGRFSFNVKGGRCEKCMGAGTLKIEMQFLPDVYVSCDVCNGNRYNSETLEVRFKGKNIFEVLHMTVDEAADFFKSHHIIYSRLKTLQEVGLGYIELGQPAPTLSGGEAQRVKLGHELSKKESGRTLYILDEPTTGLHLYDIEKLMHALYQLVEKGNTVVIIEHNMDVISACDYIIDIGPDGGNLGGNILYQGEVKGILNVTNSHTGYYLKKHEAKK